MLRSLLLRILVHLSVHILRSQIETFLRDISELFNDSFVDLFASSLPNIFTCPRTHENIVDGILIGISFMMDELGTNFEVTLKQIGSPLQ